jgi:hypothetical protein
MEQQSVPVALGELAEHGLQCRGMGPASGDQGGIDAVVRILPAG